MQLAQWKPDSASQQCDNCAKAFDLFRRRHHCRLCGGLFCYGCSNLFLPGDLLLRWWDANVKAAQTTPLSPLHTDTPHRLHQMSHSFSFSSTSSSSTNAVEPAVKLRVCTHCYETVEACSVSGSDTSLGYSHGLGAARQVGTSSCPIQGVNSCSKNRVPDVCTPTTSGRERKICVISLQGHNTVESGERADLAATFDAFEKLTCRTNQQAAAGNNPSSKDTTPSLGPSLSSASDLSGSEKNTIGPSVWENGAEATPRERQRIGRAASARASRRQRRKVVLRLPVAPPSTDASNVAADVAVRTQLVGVTHRHGFDKALLQQHTIGTDAYIILVDSEVGSPISAGNSSSVRGSPVSAVAVPHEFPKDVVASPLGTAYDSPSREKCMAMVRVVREAIARYGGDTPICAVVDCAASGSTILDVTTMSPAGSSSNAPQGAGSTTVRCSKENRQPCASVEAQASALHSALLLVVGEVLRRDVARCEG
ncbi:zinc finger protein [Trypanosoma grayi]|uniref:zinc finger protein n=1 Tax=Trypanosoma grayi TaxID=71804 RepID=UPI0004F42675|nr:zinc finger protein [Trypanosoma grayi]KEG06958.1 zinc finger protein [Trypanosoma grayi]